MSERTPTTAQGRLANFNRGNPAFEKAARKKYIDEALGDAGVTDFSDTARKRLEDQAAFDTYMKKFGADTRDSDDRYREAVDSGEIKSHEDPRRQLLARRIAVLANDILKMEADGRGDRTADNSGKTVLDYRKERLQELQDEYDYSANYDTSNTTPKPTNESPDVAGLEPDEPHDSPSDDTDDHAPETPSDDGTEPRGASHEQHKDGDPYQVGNTIIMRAPAFKKGSGEPDPSVPPVLITGRVVGRSADGQDFYIQMPDGNVQEHISRNLLDEWQTVRMRDFKRNTDGELDRSKPTGWKEWTITEGPDEDGWVRLRSGDKEIVRHRASLELWNHAYTANNKSADTAAPLETEASHDAEKEAEDFIDGLDKVIGTDSTSETKSTSARRHDREYEDEPTIYPFQHETAKKLSNTIEGLTGLRRDSIEKSTAAVRRALAREKAAVAATSKSERESTKQAIRERAGGSDRADQNADKPQDRRVMTWIGRALRLNKTSKQKSDKIIKKLGKNAKQQQKNKQ